MRTGQRNREHDGSVHRVRQGRLRSCNDGPSAIIFESPCVKLIKPGAPVRYREEACTGCGKCVLKIGCPALSWDVEHRRPVVDASLCNGCGLCTYLCEDDALECDGNEGSAQ